MPDKALSSSSVPEHRAWEENLQELAGRTLPIITHVQLNITRPYSIYILAQVLDTNGYLLTCLVRRLVYEGFQESRRTGHRP